MSVPGDPREETLRGFIDRDAHQSVKQYDEAMEALESLVADLAEARKNERHLLNLHDWRVRDLEAAKAELAEARKERDECRHARLLERHKIEAYDAARAVVKIEGNTRAYYVMWAKEEEARVVAAETRLAEATAALRAVVAVSDMFSVAAYDSALDVEEAAEPARAFLAGENETT